MSQLISVLYPPADVGIKLLLVWTKVPKLLFREVCPSLTSLPLSPPVKLSHSSWCCGWLLSGSVIVICHIQQFLTSQLPTLVQSAGPEARAGSAAPTVPAAFIIWGSTLDCKAEPLVEGSHNTHQKQVPKSIITVHLMKNLNSWNSGLNELSPCFFPVHI